MNETEMLRFALRRMTEEFDAFVGDCLKDGKPKEPPYKSLMKARGFLPGYCKNSLSAPGPVTIKGTGDKKEAKP